MHQPLLEDLLRQLYPLRPARKGSINKAGSQKFKRDDYEKLQDAIGPAQFAAGWPGYRRPHCAGERKVS